MFLIGDIGSCHAGRLDYALEAIDVAKEAGLDCIKYQLFRDLSPNIELPRIFWPEIVERAKAVKIDVFASVFDEDAISLLHDSGIKKIKLAYSQAFNLKLIRKARQLDMEIWASGNTTQYPEYADIRFACYPEYPVKSIQTEPILGKYEGLSSHWLGHKTDLNWMRVFDFTHIEKHFTLDHDDIDCPDHWFALTSKELKNFVKEVRDYEKEEKNRCDNTSSTIV